MTDQETAEDATSTEATPAPTPAAPEDAETTATEAGDDPGDKKLSKEAAKWRTRLRETEANLTATTARVEALQRAEVERIAAADKLTPKALWANGVELGSLLTDDGTVDTDKVADAIKQTRDELGIPRTGLRVRREGTNPKPTGDDSGRNAMVNTVMGRDNDFPMW